MTPTQTDTQDATQDDTQDKTQAGGQADERAQLRDLIGDITFAMLSTVDTDGELVSRPMAHQGVEDDADVWFFSSRDSRKVDHIQANPHVAVTLASSSSWVSLNGHAEIVDDPDLAEQLWSTTMEAWFPQGPRDPSIVLIKVSPSTAEYWDGPGGRVSTAISLVKAKLTGQPYAGGDNATIDLTQDH